jgi:hypothetical protein
MNNQAHIIIHHRSCVKTQRMQVSFFTAFIHACKILRQNFSMGAVLKILITRQRASLSFISFFLFPHLIHARRTRSRWLVGSRTMMRTGFLAAPQRSGVVGTKQILTRQVCFVPLLLHFSAAAAAAAVAGGERFFMRQNEVFTTCYLSGFCRRASS